MNSKSSKKSKNVKKNIDIQKFIIEKTNFYTKIIQNLYIHVNFLRNNDLIKTNDYNIINNDLNQIKNNILNIDIKNNNKQVLNNLQEINDILSRNMKHVGAYNLNDILQIILGIDLKNIILDYKTKKEDTEKIEILNQYFKPVNYTIIKWTKDNKPCNSNNILNTKNKIFENLDYVKNVEYFDFYDLGEIKQHFLFKINGLKLVIQNYKLKLTIIIDGILENIFIDLLHQNFITNKKNQILSINISNIENFVHTLTLKDYLIYSSDDLIKQFMGYDHYYTLIKNKPLKEIINEFLNDTLYQQRQTLLKLLIYKNDKEISYLCYLLYDLLNNENQSTLDSSQQKQLLDSLPYSIRINFKEAMKSTIEYTQKLNSYDENSISYDQRICLMKVPDNVKEKALLKLRELKSKNEETNSKPRQYLDGLLKIPFEIYKSEPCLEIIPNIRKNFKIFINELNHYIQTQKDNKKLKDISDNYIDYLCNINTNLFKDPNEFWNNFHIFSFLKNFKKKYNDNIMNRNNFQLLFNNLKFKKINEKKQILENLKLIFKKYNLPLKIKTSNIKDYEKILYDSKYYLDKYNLYDTFIKSIPFDFTLKRQINIEKKFMNLLEKWSNINIEMNKIKNTLEKAVYGHKKAKKQIERVIGQWMNGEQSGYCFGFEGPPGLGKTSLAKNGLSKCLLDMNGKPRPLSFIAIGGSSNGSTLEGHNYTYVGSTWGKIVDVLIETQCMNPIIFIDELDKVSKTEHGKELIGILTHLIDPTQNDCFQDKYFNGININLSKALFVFSYNDVELIDKILLDRIHRIKFEILSLKDKIIISNKYLIPEITKKFGLENCIYFSDEILKFIIENYTNESGVRKLKEILYEIISEINLEILNNELSNKFPIEITKENLIDNYLFDKSKLILKKIHSEPKIGLINGLWANAYGRGGITSIEASWFPSNNFLDLKLTGLQGDVMKESMNVAKTLAWNYLSTKQKDNVLSYTKNNKNVQGIHIHCPEGSTPKDGPSAGTAITIVLYSLFSQLKIPNDVAITGEINLQGKITAIGGLELKIIGGIKAGVKRFYFPKENLEDYEKIMKKYKDEMSIFDGIHFKPVEDLKNIIDEIFI